MPAIDNVDDFGRQVIAMDGSHDAVRLVVSFEVPNENWLVEIVAASCCPSLRVVDRSCKQRQRSKHK